MSRIAFNVCTSAVLLALAACDRSESGLPASARFEDPVAEAAVSALEVRSLHELTASCESRLGAIEQDKHPPDEAVEHNCEIALAAENGEAGAALAERYRGAVRSRLATRLTLESALGGDEDAWLDLAHDLAEDAGAADAPYAQLDAATFAAAQGAASRAVELEVDGAATMLTTLQDREFPLRGVKMEALWRAIYFRRFDSIVDTIETRRHVASMTSALMSLCEAWEMPGIASVGLSAGLARYSAPVRAEVPGRVLRAIPEMIRRVGEATSEARRDASERSAASWIEQFLRVPPAIAREAGNALATGSTTGRDAGQALFNESGGCRSQRGLRMIDSINEYFAYIQRSGRSPLDPGVQAATPGATRSQDKDE